MGSQPFLLVAAFFFHKVIPNCYGKVLFQRIVEPQFVCVAQAPRAVAIAPVELTEFVRAPKERKAVICAPEGLTDIVRAQEKVRAVV